MIRINSSADLEALRRSGALLWQILSRARNFARDGLRTIELSREVERLIDDADAEPILKSIRNARGEFFPGAACVNISPEASGAPPSDRAMRAGDLITLDVAIRHRGWCADAATSFVVSGFAPDDAHATAHEELLAKARRVMQVALDAIRSDVAWSSVVRDAHRHASLTGLSIVESMAGHGVGLCVHEPPQAGFCQEKATQRGGHGSSASQDFVLRSGMVLTFEPVLTSGDGNIVEDSDGWTLRTRDASACVGEEVMIEVTPDGVAILAGGPEWMER